MWYVQLHQKESGLVEGDTDVIKPAQSEAGGGTRRRDAGLSCKILPTLLNVGKNWWGGEIFRKTAVTRLLLWKETKTHVSMLAVSRSGARVEAGPPCAAGGGVEGSGDRLRLPQQHPGWGIRGQWFPFILEQNQFE